MASCLERMESYLTLNGAGYVVQRHRPTVTAQETAAEAHETGQNVAKVFMAWSDGQMVMLVLPADRFVDLKLAKQWLGSQVMRPARECEFDQVFPDCEVGAMPPFGNLYGVPVYLDPSLASTPYLICAAGSHRVSIRLETADYLRLVGPTIVDFTEQTRSEARPC